VKLEEEVAELREALAHAARMDSAHTGEAHPPDPRVESELGDVLFAAVNVARLAHISPEVALGATNASFEARVQKAVELATLEGEVFANLSLDQQEAYYQRSKAMLTK
jgi:ATP diphosphatase